MGSTGLFGKLPSYGDFLRRGLTQDFVGPWDDWLQAGLRAAMSQWGDAFGERWEACRPWRFRLPAGACGSAAVAGVWMPSRDAAGRRFPLTLALLLAPGDRAPAEAWYEALELAGTRARDGGASADELLAALPSAAAGSTEDGPEVPYGWWTADGRRLQTADLPAPAQFAHLWEQRALISPLPHTDAATHAGTVRSRNEDALVDRGDIGLWAVADGAGGHGAGDVASAAVARALGELPAGLGPAELLAQVRQRLGEVHAELQRLAQDAKGATVPATTVVVLMTQGEHFACLWAGDSRAYLLRDDALLQLTRDHSLTQELVDAGTLTPAEAERHPQGNVITRAIGGPQELRLDKVAGRLLPGDRFLLCSDGLYKALPEAAVAQLLASGLGAEELVARCVGAGARDNVTAVLVSIAG